MGLENALKDLYPTRQTRSDFVITERKDPIVWDNEIGVSALSEKDLKFFKENGYLFYKSLFSDKEIRRFYDEIEKMTGDEQSKRKPQYILERNSGKVRSIFEIHKSNELFRRLACDKRILNVARQILGSDVYIQQSRINLKPGFEGKEFFWHSDFETWHAEDGLPRMRTISCSINLTENYPYNGPIMVIPGSHKYFISCAGETPDDHYKESLVKQEIGTPDHKSLTKLVETSRIEVPTGPPGSALFFDCNIMHGSGGNITPFPRSNVFFVFNSVYNTPDKPYSGKKPRPEYIASRKIEPLRPCSL